MGVGPPVTRRGPLVGSAAQPRSRRSLTDAGGATQLGVKRDGLAEDRVDERAAALERLGKPLHKCYIRRMTEIAARDLRNRTADVLRRVEAGEPVTITSRGRPVAELIPLRDRRRRPIARAELVRRLGIAQADPGLRGDLAVLAGDTTDDLGPIR